MNRCLILTSTQGDDINALFSQYHLQTRIEPEGTVHKFSRFEFHLDQQVYIATTGTIIEAGTKQNQLHLSTNNLLRLLNQNLPIVFTQAQGD